MFTRHVFRLAVSINQHRFAVSPKSVGKVVCVAKNYSDSLAERTVPLAKRMNDAAIFMKPSSSITPISPSVNINGYDDVICETELALSIGTEVSRGSGASSDTALLNSVSAIAIAFDLTRKDFQTKLKDQGKPWELAKGFDRACPMTDMVSVNLADVIHPDNRISLKVNGQELLNEPLEHMILNIPDLLRTITQHITLLPGDIVLTGTPTKPHLPPRLKVGDKLCASFGDIIVAKTEVV